jgi:hypothetical protein
MAGSIPSRAKTAMAATAAEVAFLRGALPYSCDCFRLLRRRSPLAVRAAAAAGLVPPPWRVGFYWPIQRSGPKTS